MLSLLSPCNSGRHAGGPLQSGGGGGNLATVILEDEVMAEQNQDTSLLAACRSLMTAITKVSLTSPLRYTGVSTVVILYSKCQ